MKELLKRFSTYFPYNIAYLVSNPRQLLPWQRDFNTLYFYFDEGSSIKIIFKPWLYRMHTIRLLSHIYDDVSKLLKYKSINYRNMRKF